MGHTTRCVPLIQYIISLGHEITFAGNDWQRRYILDTFPGIDSVHLEGYNIRYSRSAGGFMPAIFLQIPRLLKTIRNEHKWLASLTVAQQYDGIISDNRYGLYHSSIPSVIMTHQLQPITGFGSRMDKLLGKYHYKLLNKFSGCWAVDVPGTPNLAGKLAHATQLPQNTRYIGLLSQLQATKYPKEEHLLVLLSGPEPQRTILSTLLWAQLQDYKGKAVFVEGSNDAKKPESIPPHISWYAKLTGETLQPLLSNASIVICRSGYSTIMDLVAMDKKGILIPTPGQTEQEYLGAHLHTSGIFYSTGQRGFELNRILDASSAFPFKKLTLQNPFGLHPTVIDKWLESL